MEPVLRTSSLAVNYKVSIVIETKPASSFKNIVGHGDCLLYAELSDHVSQKRIRMMHSAMNEDQLAEQLPVFLNRVMESVLDLKRGHL